MKAFWQMTLNELRSSSRNIGFVIFTLITPLIMLFLFGSLYSDKPEESLRLFEGYNVVRYSLSAYIGLVLAIISFTWMPQQLVNYRESKVLKRLKATPIKSWHIFIPIILNYLILFLIGFILLIVSSVIFFDLKLDSNVWGFFLALFLSILALFSLGLLLSCLCRNVKQVTAIGFALLVPMILFSGATMPLAAFKNDTITNVAQFVPLTQAVNFMRGMFLGQPISDHLMAIVALSAIAVTSLTLSIILFKWE